MFAFMFFVALAAGTAFALCFHLSRDARNRPYRRDLRFAMLWTGLIFIGAMLWMTADVVQDWAVAWEDSEMVR